MTYYISGIGVVSSNLTGCGNNFKKFDPHFNNPSSINRKDVLEHTYKPFGRMDTFSKIGFAGIYFSYKDSGLLREDSVNTDSGSNTSIIASTHFGCIDTDIKFFDTIKSEKGKNASPALFAFTLPNTFLGEASIYLKFSGETFVLKENTLNGIASLKMCLDILNSKESDTVICGICDAPQSDFLKNRLNISDNPFSGSLFFTIGRKKQKYCYGEIKEDENGSVLFNNVIIENLLDLARLCIENNQIKLKEKLLL